METSLQISTDPVGVPLVRKDLVRKGIRPSFIQSQVRSGKWTRVYDGIYVDASIGETQRQFAQWRCHLLAAGEGAVLSHQTAALLHGFDSTMRRDPTQVSITVPHDSRVELQQEVTVTRTRRLFAAEVVVIAGFRVTSRARTVLDLATVLPERELERVLESAIRGANPKQPDKWRTDVQETLERYASGDHRVPGAATVASVLRLRPIGCRPTGSIAETAMIQSLRDVGIVDVIRQPTLTVMNPDGTFNVYFLDIVISERRLVLEVDGDEHREAKRHRADLLRQNQILRGFGLLRCTGADALFDGLRIARQAGEYPEITVPGESHRWASGKNTVEGGGLTWTIR